MAESKNRFFSKLASNVDSSGDVTAEAISASVTSALGTSVYDSASQLPTSGFSAGDTAFVKSTSRLYINSGLGWYNVTGDRFGAAVNISESGGVVSSAAYDRYVGFSSEGTVVIFK